MTIIRFCRRYLRLPQRIVMYNTDLSFRRSTSLLPHSLLHPVSAQFVRLGPVHLKILGGWVIPRVYSSLFKSKHICMALPITPADGLEQMPGWSSSRGSIPHRLNSTSFSTFIYEALNFEGDETEDPGINRGLGAI